ALAGARPGRARGMSLRRFADPADGSPLDRGLLLWFPNPSSFTGEDVAEFHVHGGRAVVAGLLAGLAKVEGLRVAEAGEFTRRAFENGKLDLTEAEGLADLIDAETSAQRKQALRQMEGALGRLYEDWRGRLIRLLAYAEADIDFAEEDAGADEALHRLSPEIEALANEIRAHLDDGRRGERLRDGVEVAIVGPPNVGKSSLLNRIAGREAAIVSEEAGTTRDVLEVRLDLGGVPVTLADTAGLREATGKIEKEGIRRALARAESADLRLVMVAATGEGGTVGDFALAREGDLRIVNKGDLGSGPGGALTVSALTGEGVEAVVAALTEKVVALFGAAEHPVISRARHREGLNACEDGLQRALEGLRSGRQGELVAEDLRLSARALGRITGRVDVEDLLDVVFRDFCIGK
ncbi:MAG: tRNA uridine-5-carboxymethylaminomethyl(34) synthesis GTPase MnmE, partial [Parvibaculum sp.]|uniref:tRNA uridine-5-carboxymethylaminomethyl(34) synthesis GTPase MnmE n=1 Tax=Parvibaculum sp. TaxID=2024848 RepID=UPI00284D8E71